MTPAIPLVPDGDQAQEWARRELADPVYQAAQPTWFDRAAQSVRDALVNLFSPDVSPQWAAVLAIAAAVVIVVVIVVSLVVWGVPRRRRPRGGRTRELFGDVDARSAAAMRAAAASAAQRGDWDEAIVLRFRATARGLDERGLIELPPGTTARQFGVRAQSLLASGGVPVDAAARAFEDVRYLQRPGTAAGYDLVARADDALAAAGPRTDAPLDAQTAGAL